jgi:anti-sigma regulatory factor (Ser/Thr protein kinase)
MLRSYEQSLSCRPVRWRAASATTGTLDGSGEKNCKSPIDAGVSWVSSLRMYEKVLALEPKAESVRVSRDLARRTLGSVDSDLAEVAAILTNEVVANAIRHGRPPIALRVIRDDRLIVIAVADSGPGLPVMRRTDRTAENGRGLMILDAFADDWGVAPLPEGKQVWFRLNIGGHDRVSERG